MSSKPSPSAVIPMTKTTARRRFLGQAMTEMALVLPILITIALAIMEFCWMYYNIGALTYAAHEGARFAAVGNGNAEVINKVHTTMMGMSITTVEIKITQGSGASIVEVLPNTERQVGTQLTLTTRANYTYLTPLGRFAPGAGNITELRGKTTVTIEASTPQQ